MRLVDEDMICLVGMFYGEGEGSQQQACNEVCMGVCYMGRPKGGQKGC
jgi:hypothetical protein